MRRNWLNDWGDGAEHRHPWRTRIVLLFTAAATPVLLAAFLVAAYDLERPSVWWLIVSALSFGIIGAGTGELMMRQQR